MKQFATTVFIAALAVGLCSCATRNTSNTTATTVPGSSATASGPTPALGGSPASDLSEFIWPRVVVSGSTTETIHEPTVDSWDGRQVTARSAVGMQSAGQAQPNYGVVTFHAITLVDKTRREVSLENIELVGADFPPARTNAQDYLRQLRESFPKQLTGFSLDRLETSLSAATAIQNNPSPALNNSPPKIIFSTKPAILVYVDGPPVFRSVPGTDLERVINTRALLLKDKADRLYLHMLDGYLAAPGLDGPWIVASNAPAGAAQAEKQALASPTPVDLLDSESDTNAGKPRSLKGLEAPIVYVATKPAELILLDGQPNFVPIDGTKLLYVENTTANVFKLLSDQDFYVLIAGRWFKGQSVDGPWQFVPANHLPRDFANIPDTSPKENVKACVAGTSQANEALIANSIPESTKVPLSAQMQDPHIDGPPVIQPIAGTTLHQVANSDTPIIEINDKAWYACQHGVWYFAPSLDGPWSAAPNVPAIIYSIPPSSPLHYLTYVQVYGATPDSVYDGYTPGYLGTEVEDGVVVYGSGYYYPPWIGDYWYGWPCTWGFGWGPCWTPWDDWCFDFGFGWGCGFGRFAWWRCHPLKPWWGPHRGWHRDGPIAGRRPGVVARASTARNIYSPTPRAGSGAVAKSGLTTRTDYARAYNSRTGYQAGGQRSGVASVYDRTQTRGGSGGGFSAASRGFETRGYARPSFAGHEAGASAGWHGYYGGGYHGGSFGHSAVGGGSHSGGGHAGGSGGGHSGGGGGHSGGGGGGHR
jgi:hypothetical protein